MTTVAELQNEKWLNFKRAFYTELKSIDVACDDIDWQTNVLPRLSAGLVLCRNFGIQLAPIIDKRDDDLLFGWLDLENPTLAANARHVYRELGDEKQLLLWRYLRFFLDSTNELITAK